MMRAPLLFAAFLCVCACGNNDQSDNTQNLDENLSTESIVSNDVTAIDAVTGDAANMAADVDMNFGNLDENATEGTANGTATKPTKPAPKTPRQGSLSPAPEPTTNSATNTE